MADQLGEAAAHFSRWLDSTYSHELPTEVYLWRRIAKVNEEGGEVIEALLGYLGENPRKGKTHTLDDVVGELLDVAFAALGAVEHITGNTGESTGLLLQKAKYVCERASIRLDGFYKP